MILSGEHRPGAKLVQDRLAKQLGVSRGVVREALMEMKSLGLIETIDNRGAIASHINARAIVDCLEVREMMEGLAARLCCQRINREQLGQLRKMVMEVYDLSTSGQYHKAVWVDRNFHHRQIELAGNTMLIRLTENHWLLGKFLIGDGVQKSDPPRTRDEHMAILDAIESGDEVEAERAARVHIRLSRDVTEKLIASGNFSPRWLVPLPSSLHASIEGEAESGGNEEAFSKTQNQQEDAT
jgi:DNA-binding GntR family transcriptional regulator